MYTSCMDRFGLVREMRINGILCEYIYYIRSLDKSTTPLIYRHSYLYICTYIGETEVASTAGAGSLSLEFEVLSRLTGDRRFGDKAYNASMVYSIYSVLVYCIL